MSSAGMTCGQTPQLQLKVHICQVGSISSKYHSPECNLLEAISTSPVFRLCVIHTSGKPARIRKCFFVPKVEFLSRKHCIHLRKVDRQIHVDWGSVVFSEVSALKSHVS